jgi:hypothetical protein
MKKLLPHILFLLLTLAKPLRAQEGFLHLNQDLHQRYESLLARKTASLHTSIRPYTLADLRSVAGADSLDNALLKAPLSPKSWFARKLLYEHLFSVNEDSFTLAIDPVVNFDAGKDLKDRSYTPYINTRGVMVKGTIGRRFGFNSGFVENQGVFLHYIDTVIRVYRVVPGQGIFRFFKNGFDYNMAFGSIYYSPSRHFTFQFGHDKNFIGDGYRSLLLSDNSFNYPFLKILVNVWKLKYMSLVAEFQDLQSPHSYEEGFKKKYATFHYLSWNISRRLTLGVFEAVVWQNGDSTYHRGLEINYLNPVIFLRPVEASMDSPNNELLGFTAKLKVTDRFTLYGQIMLDEFNFQQIRRFDGWYANKQGYQAGFKLLDPFIKGLSVQSELNYVRPYSYTHLTYTANAVPSQNYAHYNQALAHPLGANFVESVNFLRYRHGRFFVEAKLMYAVQGRDGDSLNYGSNIFRDYLQHPNEYGNKVGQGLRTTLLYRDLRISYLLNPRTNLVAELGASLRTAVNERDQRSSAFVHFGIRTSLFNHYYDF